MSYLKALRRRPGMLVVGGTLMVAALAASWQLLTHHPQPSWDRAETDAVPSLLFVTDLALPVGDETFGPEVFVSMTVDPQVVGGCRAAEVEVRVNLRPLRERPGSFDLVVEPRRADPVRFVLAVTDLPKPANVRLVGNGKIKSVRPPADLAEELNSYDRVTAKRHGMTLIDGWIDEWPDASEQDPVLEFQFETDWVEARGLGSCYARMPALIEDLGSLRDVAGRELGGVPKVLGNTAALSGSVRTESRTGVVAQDETAIQPEPDPGFIWRCNIDRRRSEVQPQEGDRSFTQVFGRGGRTCAARVTITHARVAGSELFWSFVLAAAFSFGLGLCYDWGKQRRAT